MEVGGNDSIVVQFGSFELNLQTGELRRQGIKVKLQRRPLQILRALLKSPGAVVTRDELRRELWSEDTFVDFEWREYRREPPANRARGFRRASPLHRNAFSKRLPLYRFGDYTDTV